MNWDPFQREVLAELGHVLYRQAGVAMAPDVEAAQFNAEDAGFLSTDDPMLVRIARAADMTIEALQTNFGDMHAIAGLRGNGAAKRALWPRLRALRRQQR